MFGFVLYVDNREPYNIVQLGFRLEMSICVRVSVQD